MSGRILVVDDHPLTREGLSLAARATLPGATVVGVASIADAMVAMQSKPAFRLILLDFQLADAHGYSGLLKLQHQDPHVPIVMITSREEASLVEAAKALGAAGFVFKSRPIDEIAAILKRIVAGGTYFPSEIAASPTIAAARARIADLSPAQNAVLLALADGRSNKEIARDLDVTEATVKAHLTAVFRRLGVSNRTQALLAVRPLFEVDEAPTR
ncbi:response regulator transcription factor [Sphingomonas sp. BIUV-7]|uniref:Response regulator transcription factor n=1 Tax=Sphingomonas natans TaxID=3063330 RepID=A0ABT8YBV4_9SPHN|nr:response regulator transcription factor [Sphingomonas sp. BIUV-7]MDO6415811.1 response regulator transcription factor [Sphingomonas sp. BIUV-7]